MKSNQESNPIVVLAGRWQGGQSSRLSRLASRLRRAFSIQFWSCWMPPLFQLGRETRNFYHRIRATLQSRLYRNGVDMGQLYRRDGNGVLREHAETRCRIEDTLSLCKQRPWLTALDTEVFS